MSPQRSMTHGTVEATRLIGAPRATVDETWTALERRRKWFAGPAWTGIGRSMDLQVGGREVARGRFVSGIETIVTARFHLTEPRVRLIYAFDMHVDGEHFSVSLAGVELGDTPGGTELRTTGDAFFLPGGYDVDERQEGTNFLMDPFTAHVSALA